MDSARVPELHAISSSAHMLTRRHRTSSAPYTDRDMDVSHACVTVEAVDVDSDTPRERSKSRDDDTDISVNPEATTSPIEAVDGPVSQTDEVEADASASSHRRSSTATPATQPTTHSSAPPLSATEPPPSGVASCADYFRLDPPTLAAAWRTYWKKWLGVPGKKRPPIPPATDWLWGFIGSFIGIGILTALHFQFPAVSESSKAMLVASFGATAVLVYGVPTVPLAQPRNVLLGHMISAFIGVAFRMAIVETSGHQHVWITSALAVSVSIFAMAATGTSHPPGGATALIAVTADPVLQHLGFLYVLMPVGIGAFIMILIGLIVNNLSTHETRRYPQHWW